MSIRTHIADTRAQKRQSPRRLASPRSGRASPRLSAAGERAEPRAVSRRDGAGVRPRAAKLAPPPLATVRLRAIQAARHTLLLSCAGLGHRGWSIYTQANRPPGPAARKQAGVIRTVDRADRRLRRRARAKSKAGPSGPSGVRPPVRQSPDSPHRRPSSRCADQRGVAFWHERGYDAGADGTATRRLAIA